MKIDKQTEFGIEIRRKQKMKMMDEIRKKNQMWELQRDTLINPIENSQWVDFCQSCSEVVTPQIIKNYQLINFQTPDLDKVFSSLNHNKAFNIFFAAIISMSTGYTHQQFFMATLDSVSHASRVSQFQMKTLSKFSKIRNYQELNIFLWASYLSALTFQCSDVIYQKVSAQFFQWWSNEKLPLSYEQCSKLACSLLNYNSQYVQKQIKFMCVELMKQDRSLSTYLLISKLLSKKNRKQIEAVLLLQDQFKQFLKVGTKRVDSLPPCLKILNQIFSCYNFYHYIEQIMPAIITNISQIYTLESINISKNLQSNILKTLFNILYTDLPNCQHTFCKINFKLMLECTRSTNLWDLVDMLVMALRIYKEKQIFQLCFVELELSKLVKDLLSSSEFVQLINEDLLQTIKMLVEVIEQAISSQLHHGPYLDDIIQGLSAITAPIYLPQITALIEQCESLTKEKHEKDDIIFI